MRVKVRERESENGRVLTGDEVELNLTESLACIVHSAQGGGVRLRILD